MAISVAILGRLIAAILHLFSLLAMDTQMNWTFNCMSQTCVTKPA